MIGDDKVLWIERGYSKFSYEYKRNGVVCGFMFTEPLGLWHLSETRTKKDWAHQVPHLLDVDYPDAEKVILVCGNLNTHVPGAFYETFPPEQAMNPLNRLEIHQYAKARELARYRRDRTQCPDPSMPETENPDH